MNKNENEVAVLDKRDCIIEITFPNGEIGYASTQGACAQLIGCSRVRVNRVLLGKGSSNENPLAKGCKLRYVDMADLAISAK